MNSLLERLAMPASNYVNNEYIPRDELLKLLKEVKANERDPALTTLLTQSRLSEDKEILDECIRIEGKNALPTVLMYEKDFIYDFISKTHSGEKVYSTKVFRYLYLYHFGDKKIVDLVLSHYDVNNFALEALIDYLIYKKIKDKEILMETFEMFKSPTRELRFFHEINKTYTGMVERLLILENETLLDLSEIIDHFLPLDKEAFVSVAIYRPSRKDLLEKTLNTPNHNIFSKYKMNLSKESMNHVVEATDLMYPNPLPLKEIGLFSTWLLKNNPKWFLQRYISDFEDTMGLHKEVEHTGLCALCSKPFDVDEIPRSGAHVRCDNTYMITENVKFFDP